MRYLAPVATFPLGAAAEAAAAYYALPALAAAPATLRLVVALIIPVNLLLGFGMGYPQV